MRVPATGVSKRMSSLGVLNRPPESVVDALRKVDFEDDLTKVYFTVPFNPDPVPIFKYRVIDLSTHLVEDAVFENKASASIMSTQVIRYIYEVAIEMNPKNWKPMFGWHTGQQVVQGKNTRGAGIVAFSVEGLEMVKAAKATCLARMGRLVVQKEENRKMLEVSANAASCVV